MKKLAVLLFVFICVTGFGGLGEDENKLPKTSENYKITVKDTEGYTANLTQVSVAGGIYLTGNAGKGKHIINFVDIKKITVMPFDEKYIEATIEFRDGNQIKLTTDGKKQLKGKSKYGVYTIPLSDIREINFMEKLPQ
jgi:hypothetical protein